jgi:hypothetical protein
MISDPAALQYIFVRSGYRFPKQHDRSVISGLVNGRGISWAEGGFWSRDSNMRWSIIDFLKVIITNDSEEWYCLDLVHQSPKLSCHCSRAARSL